MREHDVEHTVLAVSPELDYVVLRRQGVTEMHRMADGVVPDRLGTPVMSCSHDHVAEYLWHLDALFVCEGSGDLVWYNRAEDWNATHLYMGPGPIYIYGKPECLLIERRCVTTGERVSCHIMQKVPPLLGALECARSFLAGGCSVREPNRNFRANCTGFRLRGWGVLI